jgi:hypothetical protein
LAVGESDLERRMMVAAWEEQQLQLVEAFAHKTNLENRQYQIRISSIVHQHENISHQDVDGVSVARALVYSLGEKVIMQLVIEDP